MQKVSPCLWYNHNAGEAVDFYLSVFKDGKILDTSYYNEENPHGNSGAVLAIYFEIMGQQYIALNGGPDFPFTNAVSFMINCEDQKEIDYYWDAFLKSGGKEIECGWINDRFGLSWQVTPRILNEMMCDKNPAKAAATMKAMMQMVKIDIAGLQRAYDNT